MPIWLIIVLSLIGGVLLLAIVLYLVVEIGYKKMFPRRGDGVNSIRYFHKDEFKGLSYKRVYIDSGKYRLGGYLYQKKNIKTFKALIIVNHGIGFWHAYLLPIIEKLCSESYLVLGYDQTSSGMSEGLRVKGMAQGVIDLENVINFVKNNDELKELPLYIFAHSWGAYSSMVILNYINKVDKVVSIAGFNSEFEMFSKYVKALIVLKPFFYLHNLIHYGKKGNLKAIDGLKKTNAKVLYIQGEADRVVDPSIGSNLFKTVNRENVVIKTIPHKGHSCFFASSSEENQGKLLAKYGLLGGVDEDFNNFVDFRKMSEVDPDIYSMISKFLD